MDLFDLLIILIVLVGLGFGFYELYNYLTKNNSSPGSPFITTPTPSPISAPTKPPIDSSPSNPCPNLVKNAVSMYYDVNTKSCIVFACKDGYLRNRDASGCDIIKIPDKCKNSIPNAVEYSYIHSQDKCYVKKCKYGYLVSSDKKSCILEKNCTIDTVANSESVYLSDGKCMAKKCKDGYVLDYVYSKDLTDTAQTGKCAKKCNYSSGKYSCNIQDSSSNTTNEPMMMTGIPGSQCGDFPDNIKIPAQFSGKKFWYFNIETPGNPGGYNWNSPDYNGYCRYVWM